jgi:hypothetical protein
MFVESPLIGIPVPGAVTVWDVNVVENAPTPPGVTVELVIRIAASL